MAQLSEKTISNDIDQLSELVDWLTAWLKSNKVPTQAAYKLRLAMEEITTNAVRYGFPTGSSGSVTARVTADEDKPLYRLEILDDGEAFNPLEEAPAPDIEQDLDEIEIGGLGVFLVQNLSEDCHYERSDGWNHLTMSIGE